MLDIISTYLKKTKNAFLTAYSPPPELHTQLPPILLHPSLLHSPVTSMRLTPTLRHQVHPSDSFWSITLGLPKPHTCLGSSSHSLNLEGPQAQSYIFPLLYLYPHLVLGELLHLMLITSTFSPA